MKKNSLVEYLNVFDLQGLRHCLFLKNQTSQTKILHKHQINLLGLDDKGLTLELATKECQKGHFLTIVLCPLPLVSKLKIEKFEQLLKLKGAIVVDGKVTEYEVNKENPKMCSIRVELSQFNGQVWTTLIESYQAQQEKLTELTEQLKLKVSNE